MIPFLKRLFRRTPDPYHTMLREMAEEFRGLDWTYITEWRPRNAVMRDEVMTEYRGQPFDPAQAELVPKGWDHDHCEFCWTTISDGHAAEGVSDAYVAKGRWICPRCYEAVIDGGRDPVEAIGH